MTFRALEKSIRVLEKSWKSPGNLFLKKGTNPDCMLYLCDFKWSLLEVKICLSHAQIGLLWGSQKASTKPKWSPLGVEFKISDKCPCRFQMGMPPRHWMMQTGYLGLLFMKESAKSIFFTLILVDFFQGRFWKLLNLFLCLSW